VAGPAEVAAMAVAASHQRQQAVPARDQRQERADQRATILRRLVDGTISALTTGNNGGVGSPPTTPAAAAAAMLWSGLAITRDNRTVTSAPALAASRIPSHLELSALVKCGPMSGPAESLKSFRRRRRTRVVDERTRGIQASVYGDFYLASRRLFAQTRAARRMKERSTVHD
jgi:hypothetical protein